MKIKISNSYQKEFEKLSSEIKKAVKNKLTLLIENPLHPGLRVKKVQGYSEVPPIMEMSLNMSYRMTFQAFPDFIYLRHIGTHEIFRRP